jgi:hypothetical protein
MWLKWKDILLQTINRAVRKPQFPNSFPEKKRESAAMCGKFSGTWERTARFLNKSDKKAIYNFIWGASGRIGLSAPSPQPAVRRTCGISAAIQAAWAGNNFVCPGKRTWKRVHDNKTLRTRGWSQPSGLLPAPASWALETPGVYTGQWPSKIARVAAATADVRCAHIRGHYPLRRLPPLRLQPPVSPQARKGLVIILLCKIIARPCNLDCSGNPASPPQAG